MKVSIEELSSFERKLSVVISSEVVTQERSKSLEELRRNVPIRGFRKGHLPKHLALTMFKKDVEQLVESNLLKEYLPKVLEEQKVEPISVPEVVSKEIGGDDTFTFAATFEVKPQFALAAYNDIPVDAKETPLTDADVEDELAKLREIRSVLKEVTEDRPVQQGDFLNAALDIHCDGKHLDKYCQSDALLEVGPYPIFPGMSEHLVGIVKNQEKCFDLALDADYADKSIAGKTLQCKVTVKAIKCKEIPAMDDDFAKSLGEFETLAELKTKIHENLAAKKAEDFKAAKGEEVMQELLKRHEFDVPPALVEFELREMVVDTIMRYRLGGLTFEPTAEDIQKLRTQYHDRAVKSVKSLLVLEAVAEKENIKIEDDELQLKIQTLWKQDPQLKKDVLDFYAKAENREKLRMRMVLEKTLSFIVELNTPKA